MLIADSAEDLAARVASGTRLALFKDNSVPMALGHALIRRGTRGLHLVTVPTGNLLPDMLIGAGCVDVIETAGVSLGEFGLAPRFVAAVRDGRVRVLDATCPALYAGLQAAEKGIPFMPLRGIIGSDILRHRTDFKTINNPFADNDPIVVLPAIRPDVAMFHAQYADRAGNVYIGRQSELKILAHAAASTLVTVEKIVETNLLEDPALAPGCLNALYVDAIAEVPGGARPLALPGCYAATTDAVRDYAKAARTQAGFDAWLAAAQAEPAPAAA